MKTKEKNSFFGSKEEAGNNTLLISCFDTVTAEEAFLNIIDQVFNEKLTPTLAEYAAVLMRVHNRLLSEGYVFTDGKFYKQNNM